VIVTLVLRLVGTLCAVALTIRLGAVNVAAPLLALVGAAGMLQAWGAEDPRAARRIVLWTGGLGAATAILFALVMWRAAGPPPWLPDETQYIDDGQRVAALWRAGEFPELTRKDILGSLHTGYQRIAALLALPGIDDTALRALLVLFNLLLLPMLGAMLWALARELALDDDSAPSNPRLGQLAAFHPAHAFWAIFALREVLMMTVLTLTLALAVRLARRPFRAGALTPLALVGSLWWLFTLRSYAAALVVVAVGLWLMFVYWRLRLLPYLPALFFVGLMLTQHHATGRIVEQMAATLASVAADNAGSASASLARAAMAVPRLLWSPYPWVVAHAPSELYLLYPAGLFQLAVIWPRALGALAGGLAWQGIRALLTLFVSLWSLALLLAFAGDAPRHAYPLMILAALIAEEPRLERRDWKQRAIPYLYAAALGGFILMQQGRLFHWF